jgi:hypothetical protein
MGIPDHYHSGHDGVLAIAVEEVDAGFEKINDEAGGSTVLSEAEGSSPVASHSSGFCSLLSKTSLNPSEGGTFGSF